MIANNKKTSSIKSQRTTSVRNAKYEIMLLYDYNKDKTTIIYEDKYEKLPRIHQLDFLKDALKIVTDEYNAKLEEFNKSVPTKKEIEILKEIENATKKRDEQKNIQKKCKNRSKCRKTYKAGTCHSL
jgi:hypothetical protein